MSPPQKFKNLPSLIKSPVTTPKYKLSRQTYWFLHAAFYCTISYHPLSPNNTNTLY